MDKLLAVQEHCPKLERMIYDDPRGLRHYHAACLYAFSAVQEQGRCGIDVVGISNFVSFLENTQDYRRDLRRAEYGDEREPGMRAFLESISPLSSAGRANVRARANGTTSSLEPPSR